MKHIFTHTGSLYGDARAGNRKPNVYLRETKNFWIDRNGGKFRKSNGSGMGEWPMWSLDLETIKPVTKEGLQ